MIRINLLPAASDAGPTPLNPAWLMGAAALLPMVFLIPFHLNRVAARKDLQKEAARLKSDLDRFQSIVAQVEALEAAKVQLTNRKNVIQQLESERLRYPQFMDDFSKLLPGNLWLTNLTTVVQPANNTLQVGMDITALDNYAVADLISNLETSQIFTEVDLGPLTAAQQANGGQTIAFHINATYKRMDTIPDAAQKS